MLCVGIRVGRGLGHCSNYCAKTGNQSLIKLSNYYHTPKLPQCTQPVVDSGQCGNIPCWWCDGHPGQGTCAPRICWLSQISAQHNQTHTELHLFIDGGKLLHRKYLFICGAEQQLGAITWFWCNDHPEHLETFYTNYNHLLWGNAIKFKYFCRN